MILDKMGLAAKADALSSQLSQVELRKMELARAMAARPKLLISDEAMAGLSSSEIDEVLDAAVQAQRRGHHDHHDRAHHACRDALLRAAHLPRRRPDHLRGNARRRWSATPACRRPTLALELTVSGVEAGYGAVQVRWPASRCRVTSGETVVLLGTNGNGKSTLMKCLMGSVRPTAGTHHARRSTAPRTI